jgi:phytoene dehydrogenase-like protein
VEGFNAADSSRISAHSILRLTYSSEKMGGSWQGRIEQGYGSLIAFLVKQVKAAKGHLLLGTQARHIDWQPGKIEVSAVQPGRTVQLEADAAVLTLPLGVWKSGKLQPFPCDRRSPTKWMRFNSSNSATS